MGNNAKIVKKSVSVYCRNKMSETNGNNLKDVSQIIYHAHDHNLISDDELNEIVNCIERAKKPFP